MDSYASERWLITTSAALVAVGMVFFFYGLVITDLTLYRAAIVMRGAILANVTSQGSLGNMDALSVKTAFSVSDTPFLIASVLMIIGACLDVWRRLHRLYGASTVQWSLFDHIDHDPIMDESHVW